MENRNYGDKYASTSTLSEAEKEFYRSFAQKVHNMKGEDLIKLNTGAYDQLTSEQMDIVAWEIRLRELEIYKRRGIDPAKEFSTEALHKQMQNKEINTYRSEVDPTILRLEHMSKVHLEGVASERANLMGMTDALLERTQALIDANPQVIKSTDLHKVMGGGVNMRAKSYIVEDSNGDKIVVDNKRIQDHYRRMYMQQMSDVTGINYLEYDTDGDNDIEYWGGADSNITPSDINQSNNVDMSDYEDY